MNKGMEEPGNDELLDVMKQIRDMRGMFIVLQGGEPLLKKNILELICRMREIKDVRPELYLGRMREIISKGYLCEKFMLNYKKALIEQNLPLFYLSTNGMLYSDEIREELYNSGFSVDVSLDSAEPEINRTTRLGMDFDRVLNSIRKYSELLPVNMSSTVTEYNVDYLEQMIPLAASCGCLSLIFSPVISVGKRKEGSISFKDRYIDAVNSALDTFKHYEDKLYLYIKMYSYHLKDENGKQLYARLLSTPNIMVEMHECAALDKLKEIYIDTDLNVYGCASMKNEKELSIGNLKEMSLKEIWNSDKRKDFLKRVSAFRDGNGDFGGCTSGSYINSKKETVL